MNSGSWWKRTTERLQPHTEAERAAGESNIQENGPFGELSQAAALLLEDLRFFCREYRLDWFIYVMLVAVVLLVLGVNGVLALWQGGDLVQMPGWRTMTYFTPGAAEYPALLDRLLYAMRHYPATLLAINACWASLTVLGLLMVRKRRRELQGEQGMQDE